MSTSKDNHDSKRMTLKERVKAWLEKKWEDWMAEVRSWEAP